MDPQSSRFQNVSFPSVMAPRMGPTESHCTTLERPPRQSSPRPVAPKRRLRNHPSKWGEEIDVEIKDMGEEGDGIARVGPGYVVFVPDTRIGERVSIELTSVRENVAFGEVVERYDS
jgi:predicted RNA-binding protein with TRAM domain